MLSRFRWLILSLWLVSLTACGDTSCLCANFRACRADECAYPHSHQYPAEHRGHRNPHQRVAPLLPERLPPREHRSRTRVTTWCR